MLITVKARLAVRNCMMLKPGNTTARRQLHGKIEIIRGKASEYNCVDCGSEAYHWTWIHNTDDEDIYNYTPRCTNCHYKYDFSGERNPSTKLTWAEVNEIRKMYATGQYSQYDLAKIFHVNQMTICRIVNYKTWRHI